MGALAAFLGLLAVSCSSDGEAGRRPGPTVNLAPGAGDEATLTGAGSSFLAPLMAEWARQYKQVAPGVTISYQAVGSGQGLERLESDDVDFAVSEAPLTASQQLASGGFGEVVQLPWAAGGVALAYNLPGVEGLQLSARTVAGIFAGTITQWDDPAVEDENPNTALPSTPVRVVFRSDAAGTTLVLSQYLRAAAPEVWSLRPATRLTFPSGTGAEGDQELVATVGRTVGAIGYTAPAHARAEDLSTALVRNMAGKPVAPTAEAVGVALAGASTNPSDLALRLFYTPEAPGAYPISTPSYVMYQRPGTGSSTDGDAQAIALRHFVVWALTEGQRSAEGLGYGPVPRNVLTRALREAEG